MDKPSIVSVIGERVSLRKAGKEYIGLCPLHIEKTPSFTVNEEKGVFYCHGCGEDGDVIRFIEKIEGVSFSQALAFLGINRSLPSDPRRDLGRQAAHRLTQWSQEMSIEIGSQLREIGDRQRILRQMTKARLGDASFLREEEARCSRMWRILSDLQDDLANPDFIPELWNERASVEEIAHG